MANTNYLTSIVKILEIPNQKFLPNNIVRTECRALLPQTKTNQIVDLVIWGDLSQKILPYCQPNDYILLEGFVKVSNPPKSRLKKLQITIFKAYPIFLTSYRSSPKRQSY